MRVRSKISFIIRGKLNEYINAIKQSSGMTSLYYTSLVDLAFNSGEPILGDVKGVCKTY